MPRKKTLDIEAFLQPEDLACQIANKWQIWNSSREQKLEEWRELRNYIFATDTRTTSNSQLPWANSTTTPKLTQIRDNLHANYFAALFPNRNWMKWEADDSDSASMEKVKAVTSYLKTKIRASTFMLTMDKLLDDWLLYGNCFAKVDYERDYVNLDGDNIPQYIGPLVSRISPLDIVFNPLAESFETSPKIIREHYSLGDVRANWPEMFDKVMSNRHQLKEIANVHDVSKHNAFVADGFKNIEEYYGSEVIEVLTFYGDIYDHHTDTFHEHKEIKVVDRSYILEEKTMPSWLGDMGIYHIAWRNRPDNIWGMGPLDNLVGLQYRIDHLENLKADVFDQIAYPMIKVTGEVEDWEYAPGERIYIGEEGDVQYLVPEATALQADFQIDTLELRMEEMAGAPKQAMGLRTPGEKTAFEVETLATGANRIFQHKAAHFERKFLEPLLNGMLECGRRNLGSSPDDIQLIDDDTGTVMFQKITREDITARGKIIPVGARHFAERAQRIRELTNLQDRKLTDPSFGAHISGKELARLMTSELGEEGLFQQNIAYQEQVEAERFVQELQVQAQESQQVALQENL